MSRDKRVMMAKQTVDICEAGYYETPAGKRVSIADQLAKAKAGTVLYSPGKILSSKTADAGRATHFEVRNETTLQVLARLAAAGDKHPACLNFASAKNPGGGFLNGSLAQEESLTCILYKFIKTGMRYQRRG